MEEEFKRERKHDDDENPAPDAWVGDADSTVDGGASGGGSRLAGFDMDG